MQNAYVSAYRAIGSFNARAAFGTWLYRIVYNACVDELRRRPARAHVTLEDARDHPDRGDQPADVIAERGALAAALAALTPEHRAVVLLVDAEGFSYEEAAAALGISSGTVGSRLSRARAALRPALSAAFARDGAP